MFNKFLRNALFYLTAGHPSVVQLELISGHLDWPRPAKETSEPQEDRRDGLQQSGLPP